MSFRPRSATRRLPRLAGVAGLWVWAVMSVAAGLDFLNPGFEDANPAGTGPSAWAARNQPVWTDDPAVAHSGGHAVRTSAFHDFNQALSGLSPRTHVTFVIHSRPAEPPARFNLYATFNPTVVEPNWFSRRHNLSGTGDYGPVAIPMAVLPGATTGKFFAQSAWSEEWVLSDDARLLVERIGNGGFEPGTPSAGDASPGRGPAFLPSSSDKGIPSSQADSSGPPDWTAIGAAEWSTSATLARSGTGAAHCGIGAGWSQTFAAMDDGQVYAIAFHCRTDSTPGMATVSLDWLDSRLQPGVRSLMTFPVQSDWRPVSFSLTPPRDPAPAAARLRLVLEPGSGVDSLWVDDVALGWVGAFPGEFSPNADGLWDATEFLAWWPIDSPLPPTGRVFSLPDAATSAVLTFSPAPDGDPGLWSFVWEGDSAAGPPSPEGEYLAAISLPLDEGGGRIEVAAPLTLRRSPVYPAEPEPFPQEEPFLGGVWLFLGGPWTNVDYDVLFKLAQSDGFGHAIAFPPPGRYAECVRVAARYGLRVVLNFWETGSAIAGYWRNRTFTENDVRGQLESLISESDGLSSPVLGFYIVDEPHVALHIEWAAWFLRVLEDIAPGRPGFVTLLGNSPSWPSWFQAIGPAVAMFDRYPLSESAADPSGALLEYARLVESRAAEAEADGRPCWIVGQGISTPGRFEPPGAGGMRALVYCAVAGGARGFFPFLYLSSGNLEGLRGLDRSPRPRLAALRQAYDEIEALGSLLVMYRPDPETEAIPVEGPVYAKLWHAGGNPQDRLVWVVNLDIESTRTLEIEWAQSGGRTTRILAPGGGVPVPVPEGRTPVRVAALAPGGPPDPLAFPLPVIADAPVPSTVHVVDLAAGGGGRYLAAACAENGFVGGGVYVVDTMSPSPVPLLAGRLFAWSAESVAFDDGGVGLAVCDSLRGLDVYDVSRFSSAGATFASLAFEPPVRQWAGVSGNAHDAASDGAGGWWTSAGFRGLRHLAPLSPLPEDPRLDELHHLDVGGTVNRLAWVEPRGAGAAAKSRAGAGREARARNVGGFEPGRRLAVLDEYAGIHILEMGEDGALHPAGFAPSFRVREAVAFPGHLAVAREEYGLDIYEIFESSTPALRAGIPALSAVRDLAVWEDRVLLAADGRAGLRVFDVVDPARPREIARVRPWTVAPPFLTSVAAAPDWIAVAGRGRGVTLLDPAPLRALLPSRTWMLY